MPAYARGASALGLGLALLAAAACNAPERAASPAPSVAAPPSTTASPDDARPVPPPPPPIDRGITEIYFPSAAGDGLAGEYGEVFVTVSPEDRIKQIVNDLIAGPGNVDSLGAVPSGTELRQAYVLPDGTAYLDFTAGLLGIGGGSLEELLVVYAIVDSVAHNVSEVQRVGILVDGQVIDSLNGHVDLRRPLRPDYSWVLVPAVVERGRPSNDAPGLVTTATAG